MSARRQATPVFVILTLVRALLRLGSTAQLSHGSQLGREESLGGNAVWHQGSPSSFASDY